MDLFGGVLEMFEGFFETITFVDVKMMIVLDILAHLNNNLRLGEVGLTITSFGFIINLSRINNKLV